MVGRDAQMEQIRAAFAQAVAVSECRMVTVVGDAGVGKSRLLAEFIKERAAAAYVIRGRCLPYGEGITFWPLREAVRDAAGIDPNDSADEARAKLAQLVPDAEVVRRLASAIGLSTDLYPVEEVVWAARKFLEGLAGARPVIMVIDDIQWASPTFLDLIGTLIESVADASVLLLCTSRHLRGPDPQPRRDARVVKHVRLPELPLVAAAAERRAPGLQRRRGASRLGCP